MSQNPDLLKSTAKRVTEHFGGPAAVARALGYDDIRNVAYWTSGKRWFPPKHCVTIERLTQGRITRRELRPYDFADFWPDLVVEA